MSNEDNHYDTIRLPRSLVKRMDKLVGKSGFTSRAEIAKEAIRRILKDYEPKAV